MDEINDIGNVIANIIDNKGEDKRNFFGILRAQRGATDLYNISGDSLNLLNEAYKSNKIGADEYKEGLRNIIEATGNDLGLNVSLVYLDTSTMPKDSERSTGSSYIVDRKNRKVLIPIDVNKIEDIKELLGTLTEEVAHGKDALEGRQDKKVAEDKSNDEEGLETLGRPANEYVKKKFGEDNNSKIKLTTDGIDLTNANVGEKVGDGPFILAATIGSVIGGAASYKYYKNTEAIIDTGIENVKNKENVKEYIKTFKLKGKLAMLDEMAKEFKNTGFSNFSNKLFAIYGTTDEIRKIYLKKELDKESNKMADTLVLDKFFPEETKRLWKSDKTFENLYKVTYFWYDKVNQFGEYKIDYDNRERSTRARPDFTWNTKNSEFYALGTTLLFQSTYGSVKKTKYDKYVEYDVDIKVIFQYKDKFEDAKNINPLQNAAQNKGMEFEGGAPFNFRTELREVSVKGKFTNIKDIEIEIKKNMLKQLEEE